MDKIKQMAQPIYERIAYMMLFAMAFSVIGYFVPKFYYEFLDKTTYFSIEQPVPSEYETYRRGDYISLILTVRSLVDITATQSASLIHVNGDAVAIQLSREESPEIVTVRKTGEVSRVIKTHTIRLPCHALDGRNFIQVVFTYSVNGVEKTYPYVSDIFNIEGANDGLCGNNK